MSQSFRLPTGGRIDRSRPLTVTVDGRPFDGYAGDTLASVLMASGVRVAGRGVYSGRPRGLMSAGREEANVFVQVLSGTGEPMVRATALEAYDGLAVASLAGKGTLRDDPDTGRYDKRHAHADVVVVGGGRSGAAAALEAARRVRRVVLAHDGPGVVDAARLAAAGVRVLARTAATGVYDGGYLVAFSRGRDDSAPAGPEVTGGRLWTLRAGRIVLATGAYERPLALSGNDVPGVMLAGSAVRYAEEYAVLPGRRAVVLGCHDGALNAARRLRAAGVDVPVVVDTRAAVPGDSTAPAGLEAAVVTGGAVLETRVDAEGVLRAVVVADGEGSSFSVECDLLAVTGGWDPALQLYTSAGGRTRWSTTAAAYVPDVDPAGVSVVGRATGAGLPALLPQAAFLVGPATDPATVYLDLQRDVTLADLRRAVGAGLRSPEHVKRYTTIGTGADQGRSSAVLSLGVLAAETGASLRQLAPTTSRPPDTPIPFAVLAGRDRGRLADPERVTAIHDWHLGAGAVFEDVGQWKRPWYFPAYAGEPLADAVARECAAVRSSVGMMDASTLGKIELQGADAGEFLDRLYTNLMSTLAVGRVRYGVMCGVDGMVIDDGTVARICEDRWIATTTTGNAARILDWMEEWLQTEWPQLDVRCTSVTEQWATIAVAGPRSRDVIAALVPDLDVSNAGFGFMQWRDAALGEVPVRIMRISFSGELAYEVNVSGWYGQAVWEAISEAGRAYGITPYGTETMHVLRAEKGYPIIGQDTDGTVTPYDLGMGWVVSKKKRDFVGKRSHARSDARRPGRRQLVGLVPVDGRSAIGDGSQLVAPSADLGSPPVPMLGHVTSAYTSVALGGPFALALLEDGASRHGEQLQAVDDRVGTAVRVTGPVLYDPEGLRRDGD